MKNLSIFIVMILVALTGFAVYSRMNNQNRQKARSESVYISKVMPISFVMLKNYAAEEKNHLVILKHRSGQNSIIIHRVATNFETGDEYITDLSTVNKLKVSANIPLKINGKDFRRIEYFADNMNKQVYVTVYGGWAYTVEASSPILSEDLITVVRSIEIAK